MTDIVERLRWLADHLAGEEKRLQHEAADEIERLRAQLVSDINAEEKIDQLESEIERLRGEVSGYREHISQMADVIKVLTADNERLRADIKPEPAA